MKNYSLTILLLFCGILNAQTNNTSHLKKNSWYAEASGNSYLMSINYERIFYQKNKIKTSVSLGIDPFMSAINTAFSKERQNKSSLYLYFPMEFHLFIGRQKNFLELGIGHTLFLGTNKVGRYNQEYIDYNSVNPNNGVHFSTKPPETIYYRQRLFNLRIGYRHQKEGKQIFWKASWVPMLVYNFGYKMEPYDKQFRFYNNIWADGSEHEPIPTNYYNSNYLSEIQYKSGLYLLSFGLAIGYNF